MSCMPTFACCGEEPTTPTCLQPTPCPLLTSQSLPPTHQLAHPPARPPHPPTHPLTSPTKYTISLYTSVGRCGMTGCSWRKPPVKKPSTSGSPLEVNTCRDTPGTRVWGMWACEGVGMGVWEGAAKVSTMHNGVNPLLAVCGCVGVGVGRCVGVGGCVGVGRCVGVGGCVGVGVGVWGGAAKVGAMHNGVSPLLAVCGWVGVGVGRCVGAEEGFRCT
jgi:hypothetical protein